jgi:hypothetical protein
MNILSSSSQWLLRLGAVALIGMQCAQAQDSRDSESATAPEAFAVLFETTNGSFVVEAYREWAPNAADRFFALVKEGYFDGNLFYWVDSKGDVRFGVNGTPSRRMQWTWPLPADPPQRIVRQGYIYFRPGGTAYIQEVAATIGILTAAIDRSLAQQDVAAFGRVVEEIPDPARPAGSGVLQSLYSSHMQSRKLNQLLRRFYFEGDAQMKKEYPNLDSIVHATLLDREVAVPIREPSPALTEAKRNLPEGSAMVRIYRPGPRGLNPVDFNLRVDGETRAVFKDGTIFETVLPAGPHTFSATRQVAQVFVQEPALEELLYKGEIALDLQPGEIYYLRGRQSGPSGAILALYQVASEYGAEEAANNLPAEPKGRQD